MIVKRDKTFSVKERVTYISKDRNIPMKSAIGAALGASFSGLESRNIKMTGLGAVAGALAGAAKGIYDSNKEYNISKGISKKYRENLEKKPAIVDNKGSKFPPFIEKSPQIKKLKQAEVKTDPLFYKIDEGDGDEYYTLNINEGSVENGIYWFLMHPQGDFKVGFDGNKWYFEGLTSNGYRKLSGSWQSVKQQIVSSYKQEIKHWKNNDYGWDYPEDVLNYENACLNEIVKI